MPHVRRWWAPAAGVLLAGIGLAVVVEGRQARVPDVAPVDFDAQVRPLLSDRCYRCHGPDPGTRKAKLRLDTREGLLRDLGDGLAVVTPHDPAASELVRRISLDPSDDDVMPPSDSHLVLTGEERDLLRRWVAEGAEYRAHWSLEPLRDLAVPAARPDTVAGNPIDAFVRVRLAERDMAPAPQASKEVLARRVALSLTGLPPTPEEIDAFVADTSADAYARMVERHLASPAYGERMALDWLDLARYADTYGYQADVPRDVSPYRDWVIRAFNENLPYDQFLTWQLAGDLLPDATRDQRIATAFNRLHRQTNEGGSIEEEFRIEYVVDRVNTFGTAMLGLTLECARCHDHKFDPITQREYFALSAFFNSIDESGLYSHFTRATPTPTLLLWPAHEEAAHESVRERIAATEARLQELARDAGEAFRAWRAEPRPQLPAPVAHLRFDETDGKTTPDSVATTPARLEDGPTFVAGTMAQGGGAFRFSGDNAVVHPGAPVFGRTQPFSLDIRLQPTVRQPRAIVVHQSRAWSDAGSRGYELTLEDGRPLFALVHFWPGNAVAVRATTALPIGVWSRLVVTYDGSSRASGIRMYLDGAPLQTDVVRDRLYKDITYDKSVGDTAEATPLTVGARFRDSGFTQGLVDDLRVFDVALTPVEVAGVITPGTSEADLSAHFLARRHGPSRETAEALRRLRADENNLIAGVPELMVMEELPAPRPAHLLARGSYDAPGDVVARGTPASLPPFPADQPRNRLGLARWLTSPEHPLTARVVVNRIWRMHFGRGLVATPEDFGTQGRRPSHPELLDWLARRFVQDGWDVKALHRLILSSATFRQSSVASAEIARRDPDNEWLARGPTVRLPAEHIRDSALAASGLLTRAVGGPSVKPYQPDGLWEQSGTGQTYTQDHGRALYRRSLYTFWRRTSPPPSMTAFDAVSREVCVARREVTATPLQSLVLLNDPQFVEAARVLAERLVRRYPRDTAARNHDAFRTLVGRTPDAREAEILARTFEEQYTMYAADADAAGRLVTVGESPPDASLPAADVAAMSAVASLIMNTDEFIRLR